MKKLILIFFAVSFLDAYSEDTVSIVNIAGSQRALNIVTQEWGGFVVTSPGQTVFVPKNTLLQNVYIDEVSGQYHDDGDYFTADKPYIYLMNEGGIASAGIWEVDSWEALNMGVLCAVPVCGWLLGCWLFRRGLGIGNGALGED